MKRAKWYEVTGCVFGGRLISHTIKATSPDMARKKVRVKYKRGAFAGYPLGVRKTIPPRGNPLATTQPIVNEIAAALASAGKVQS